MALYTTLDSFRGELRDVNANNSSASNVSGMWMTILQHRFAVQSGFSHRPEYYNSKKGFTDVTSVRWLQQPASAPPANAPPANAPLANAAPANPQPGPTLICRPFLITQTKAARYQRHPSQWSRGEDQLREYLEEFNQSATHRKWFWGILATGRSVRLYRYNRHTNMMSRMKRSTLDVERSALAIERALNEMERKSR
ncbi:hypothetical protein BJX96DRAFT_177343 [Aspergillus floccosus]